MARQIQLRRGTAAEHETFTGADGEVTVDTTNRTLRVHDGVTPGGVALAKNGEGMPANADYVVAFQAPTAANGYTWYRKYKSGWIEQGGCAIMPGRTTVGSSSATVTLPVPFADLNQIIVTTNMLADYSGWAFSIGWSYSRSTNSTLVFDKYNSGGEMLSQKFNWTAKGCA